jgi:hypothetical protein
MQVGQVRDYANDVADNAYRAAYEAALSVSNAAQEAAMFPVNVATGNHSRPSVVSATIVREDGYVMQPLLQSVDKAGDSLG